MTTTPTSGAADLPEALRRSTAADGKTELFNLPGYPLMVRAVDFNRIHTESEMRRAALLDETQKTALAAGQATAAPAQPAAQQPHRSGRTAGTDEECVQRGCGTNCLAVSPQAAQQAPRDAERELEMTQQFNAGRQYEAGRIAARVAAAPAGATERENLQRTAVGWQERALRAERNWVVCRRWAIAGGAPVEKLGDDPDQPFHAASPTIEGESNV